MSDRCKRPRSEAASVSGPLSIFYTVRCLKEFYAKDCDPRFGPADRFYIQLKELETRLLFRLDINSSISITPYERDLIRDARALKCHILRSKEVELTAYERSYLEIVKERGLLARKEEQISRVVWELHEVNENGWYPVFVTLTVNARNYRKVFSRNSDAWRTYHRAVSARS